MTRRDPYRSLSPTLAARMSVLVRPAWARTALARRVAAGVLALLAVALFFRGDPHSDRAKVVVAAHDLQPGRVVVSDDVVLTDYRADVRPDGSAATLDEIVGKTVAGATRRGEPITDARILGPRLAAVSTGTADARVVPLRLADAGVAELLREGDRVDVFTADDHAEPDSPAPNPTMLAADAVVVLVSPAEGGSSGTGRGGKERVVMLALPTADAGRIATASLTSAMTVTFH